MRLLAALLGDLRLSLRGIRRAPLTPAVIAVSLGAGIGLNTVVFSWLDAAVLRPLPGVRSAASLLLVELRRADGSYTSLSWRQYQDYRQRVTTLRDLLAFRMAPLYVGEQGETERQYGLLVSDNYFTALGLAPAAGRFLLPGEVSKPGEAPVVVVSYDYWQTRFAGSGSAIGQSLRVNGVPLTIIGVTPRGFEGTVPRLAFKLFLPATLAPVVEPGSRELDERSIGGYSAIGVPAAHQSRASAQADIRAASLAFARDYPTTDGAVTADVLRFWDAPFGPQRFMAGAIAAVQGALLLMLLSVCANTANLLLTRALSRQREIGIRLALGAARGRIAALVYVDALVLALLGSAIGAAFAWWGTDAFRAMPPLRVRGLPITFDTHFSAAGVACAAALGLACAILFATPVAYQFARADPAVALRSASLRVSPSRIRSALMSVQVALAVFVLIAGALALESFFEARTAPTGFRTRGLLLAAYDLNGPGTPRDPREFAGRVLAALHAVPGVEDAAIAASVPLDIHGLPTRPFAVEGHAPADNRADEALTNTVTPGYFRVMDVPFLEGGDFASLDDPAAAPQAVVNDAFVRAYLAGLDPIGRVLTSRGRAFRICGVVRTSLSDSYGEPPLPVIYVSYRDVPGRYGEIHVRTRPGGEAAVTSAVRAAVRTLDPEIPLFDIRTMADHIDSNLLFRRIPARLALVISPILAALVGMGVYALVAFAASRRRQEIAVRLAVGGSPIRVLRAFVGDTLRAAIAGCVLGLTAAAIVLLSGTSPSRAQIAVSGSMPVAVTVIAAAAAFLPARRAISHPAWESLRDE